MTHTTHGAGPIISIITCLLSSLSLHMAAEVSGGSFNLGTPGTGDVPLPPASNLFWENS